VLEYGFAAVVAFLMATVGWGFVPSRMLHWLCATPRGAPSLPQVHGGRLD